MLLPIDHIDIVSTWNLNLDVRPVMKEVLLVAHHLTIGTRVEVLGCLIHVLGRILRLTTDFNLLS